MASAPDYRHPPTGKSCCRLHGLQPRLVFPQPAALNAARGSPRTGLPISLAMSSSLPIALLYDNDGYVEALPASTQDSNRGLMGRQVAGKEFLDAYLNHGSWNELVALVRNEQSADRLVRYCQEHPSTKRRPRQLRVLDEHRFHELFFPKPPACLIYNPCPPDLRYAWARQHGGPAAYALCGVTHTLCSVEAIEWLCDLVTAPFEPYDALICTSRAVHDMVRTVTTTYADYLRDRHGGTPQARIALETIPLGVNTERFRSPTPQERAAQRHAFQVADDEVCVLFVGRLSHHGKAHPFAMLRGVAEASRRTGRKVHLILAGWAAHPAVLTAFQDGIQTFAAGIRASIVDGHNPAVRSGVWHAADIFTSLSDNIQETFGLVMVEAMASGLPVVASDWNGYRDLVVDGETGCLVPTHMIPGASHDATARLAMQQIDYDHFLGQTSQCVAVDNAAAADAFARLLSDASLRQAMGVAGRSRAERLFAWPRIIGAYEELWARQETERLASARLEAANGRPFGSARFAAPEHTFAKYPTRWLDDECRLHAAPDAEARLNRLLAMPLTNHVARTRCDSLPLLRQVIALACPGLLVELESELRRGGVSRQAARATLAWMLKYDLLRIVGEGARP